MITLTNENNTIGSTYSNSNYLEYKENKNIFEEVIDALMIDQYSDEPELTDFIKSLPSADKRMAILSLLDSDNNMWIKLKSLIENNNISKVEQIKDVVLMLREYVKIAEVEKKKFGEVMTPLELVKEMLTTLPEEVWSNPDLKWLDPANGTGPYPIMVIYKLMKGLESWETNEELRYKHIIENMIYVCELQPKNMFLYLCAVDPKDEYKCNIYTGSFLDDRFDNHMKKIWKVEKFDIVIGNPPYQEDGATGDNKLYLRFISKALKKLNSNYLLFITPYKTIENFLHIKNRGYIEDKYNFLYLALGALNFKKFNVGSSFCYYLIKNENIENQETIIKYVDNNIELFEKLNIYTLKKIPSIVNKITLSILSKTVFNNNYNKFELKVMKKQNGSSVRIRKQQIERNIVNNEISTTHKYTIIDKLKSKGITKYFFTEKLVGHNNKKVILSKGGSYTFPIYDSVGNMSASDNLLIYLVDNDLEGNNFIEICNSKLVKFIENIITKGNDMDFSWTICNLPYINGIKTNSIDNNYIYNYFNLTQEEIALIDK